MEIAERKKIDILENLNLKPKEYALATVHRAENTDVPERLFSIFSALKEIASKGLPVAVTLHPRTRNALDTLSFFKDTLPQGLCIIEPVTYFEMLILEKNAKVILTDSGGVKKEAFFFRVPCVTLREEMEWIETGEAGWNKLVGTDRYRIAMAIHNLTEGKQDYFPFGEGNTSEKVVKIICE